MAVPKRKTSKMKKRQRRSHHHIVLPNLIKCPNCEEFKLPHRVCPSCGFYKGRPVIELKKKGK